MTYTLFEFSKYILVSLFKPLVRTVEKNLMFESEMSTFIIVQSLSLLLHKLFFVCIICLSLHIPQANFSCLTSSPILTGAKTLIKSIAHLAE